MHASASWTAQPPTPPRPPSPTAPVLCTCWTAKSAGTVSTQTLHRRSSRPTRACQSPGYSICQLMPFRMQSMRWRIPRTTPRDSHSTRPGSGTRRTSVTEIRSVCASIRRAVHRLRTTRSAGPTPSKTEITTRAIRTRSDPAPSAATQRSKTSLPSTSLSPLAPVAPGSRPFPRRPLALQRLPLPPSSAPAPRTSVIPSSSRVTQQS